MANYDLVNSLSPLDFELLSKDLLEVELGIKLENFRDGKDKGIDLRYSPGHIRVSASRSGVLVGPKVSTRASTLIVQCKRYSKFSDLKSELAHKEITKVKKLNPARYILTTSLSLSPQQVDEIKMIMSPFILATGDVFGRERLNSILTANPEIERRNIKLWVNSAGVLDSILDFIVDNCGCGSRWCED